MKLTLRELRETIRETLTEINKPPYDGKFFGQIWRTEGPRQRVMIPGQDKNTGETYRFPIYRKTYIDVVWDGHNWLSKAEFDSKHGRGNKQPGSYDPKTGKGTPTTTRPKAPPGAGGRESVEDFLKRGGRIKR